MKSAWKAVTGMAFVHGGSWDVKAAMALLSSMNRTAAEICRLPPFCTTQR